MLSAVIAASAQPTHIQFASAQYAAGEISGVATVTVEITWGDPFNVCTVDYATANGTAMAGLDYVAQNGTLGFEYPETLKTFTLSILDDRLAEGDETLLLTLRNPALDGVLGQSNAVLTIWDDKPWSRDDPFLDGGWVLTVARQEDGKLVVGGRPSGNLGGIARLNPDGSLDGSFDSATVIEGLFPRVHALGEGS
ncbi:MAG: hypothetical protein L0Y58_04005 [Verrucomicrobia subdivision 3 bacterium]|nr:hypothetical protein [Limisphaerales bacterium]